MDWFQIKVSDNTISVTAASQRVVDWFQIKVSDNKTAGDIMRELVVDWFQIKVSDNLLPRFSFIIPLWIGFKSRSVTTICNAVTRTYKLWIGFKSRSVTTLQLRVQFHQ